MTYSEKLKDPRWQKKRLEILIRDRFTCQICGYVGSKVNVHHLEYNGEPWEIDNDKLITLCRYCHRTTHTPEINSKRTDKLKIGEIIKEHYGTTN